MTKFFVGLTHKPFEDRQANLAPCSYFLFLYHTILLKIAANLSKMSLADRLNPISNEEADEIIANEKTDSPTSQETENLADALSSVALNTDKKPEAEKKDTKEDSEAEKKDTKEDSEESKQDSSDVSDKELKEEISNIVKNDYEVSVKLADLQADPNSPLYSVKKFDELGLYVSIKRKNLFL